MSSISTLLFSGYRRRVLGLLLLHPELRYHVREIARLTSTAPGTLHRELSKLAKSELLTREVSGNQVYYQANLSCPIYEELASILRKTSWFLDVLANALASLADKIIVAFVYGSMARGEETSSSDVDVLIIGEIDFSAAGAALYSAQTILRREINPKVYRIAEWQNLVDNKNMFAEDIISQSKLLIIGDLNNIE